MNDRTATPGQGGSTLGKASSLPVRYHGFTDKQLDAALEWLRVQGSTPWAKRLRVEDDHVVGDLRGMPPVIRQMVRDMFDALQLMTPAQVRQLMAGGHVDRAELIDQVLAEAGR